MDRRTFIGRVASGLLAVPVAVEAQQAARLPRIGVLFAGNTGTGTEVLRQGLQELGYVEGRTAVIECDGGKASPNGCATQPRKWCDSIWMSLLSAVPKRPKP